MTIIPQNTINTATSLVNAPDSDFDSDFDSDSDSKSDAGNDKYGDENYYKTLFQLNKKYKQDPYKPDYNAVDAAQHVITTIANSTVDKETLQYIRPLMNSIQQLLDAE